MADLIDRQAAIDILMKEWKAYKDYPYVSHVRHGLEIAIAILDNKVPSAQRTGRKKGKLIGTEYDGYADGNPVYYEWKCSECGCIFEDEEPTYNFCPNCGADMRGEQNDSV